MNLQDAISEARRKGKYIRKSSENDEKYGEKFDVSNETIYKIRTVEVNGLLYSRGDIWSPDAKDLMANNWETIGDVSTKELYYVSAKEDRDYHNMPSHSHPIVRDHSHSIIFG